MFSRRKLVINPSDAKLFEGVSFLVNATHTEQYFLWMERFYHPQFPELKVKSWEEVGLGYVINIGTLGRNVISVDVSYAIINGHKVLFYDGVSSVVDYSMINDWIRHFTIDSIRYDNGSRWAHCDAMNFGSCIKALKEK